MRYARLSHQFRFIPPIEARRIHCKSEFSFSFSFSSRSCATDAATTAEYHSKPCSISAFHNIPHKDLARCYKSINHLQRAYRTLSLVSFFYRCALTKPGTIIDWSCLWWTVSSTAFSFGLKTEDSFCSVLITNQSTTISFVMRQKRQKAFFFHVRHWDASSSSSASSAPPWSESGIEENPLHLVQEMKSWYMRDQWDA